MALAGVDALKELELYDTAETGVLELCEKPPSDVSNGLSLWRSRDPSRLSLIVTTSRCPATTSVPHSPRARVVAWSEEVAWYCVMATTRERYGSLGTEFNQALDRQVATRSRSMPSSSSSSTGRPAQCAARGRSYCLVTDRTELTRVADAGWHERMQPSRTSPGQKQP